MFVNQNTGFVSGGDLLKSSNGGENWFSINRPNQTNIEDMYVLNNDTIWLVDNNSFVGGVFRTTNGGLSWTQQFSAGTENPNKIFLVPKLNLGTYLHTKLCLTNTNEV
jgi:photosystem II stability/assembly factor-like uncharacterized protein